MPKHPHREVTNWRARQAATHRRDNAVSAQPSASHDLPVPYGVRLRTEEDVLELISELARRLFRGQIGAAEARTILHLLDFRVRLGIESSDPAGDPVRSDPAALRLRRDGMALLERVELATRIKLQERLADGLPVDAPPPGGEQLMLFWKEPEFCRLERPPRLPPGWQSDTSAIGMRRSV